MPHFWKQNGMAKMPTPMMLLANVITCAEWANILPGIQPTFSFIPSFENCDPFSRGRFAAYAIPSQAASNWYQPSVWYGEQQYGAKYYLLLQNEALSTIALV